MSTRAFMLIETENGKAEKVVDTLHKFSEVKSAYTVSGLYDVIAIIEKEDISSLGKLLADEIDTIDGINVTVVSICV
jgi:DNA-binding Lrp family transcriptional regulator